VTRPGESGDCDVESPRFWWGAFVIVVELLDGFGGEVVEVLVRAFGVEARHPFDRAARQPTIRRL
jgi:hypothetical protein